MLLLCIRERDISRGSLVQEDGERAWFLLLKLGPKIHRAPGERRSCCKSRRSRFLRGVVAHGALTVLLWGQVRVWHRVGVPLPHFCVNSSWFLQRGTERNIALSCYLSRFSALRELADSILAWGSDFQQKSCFKIQVLLFRHYEAKTSGHNLPLWRQFVTHSS